MKSYGQFCALARALDVVGDRWTMLIVRELLIGPCRYSDLVRSLPGIASNLLAGRLKALEEAGVVIAEEVPPPVSARVYSLTDRGRGLQTVLVELARWGSPLMAEGPGGDRTRGRWLAFAAMSLFPSSDDAPDPLLPDMTIRIDADGEHVEVRVAEGRVAAEPCPANATADVVLTGAPDEVFALLAGNWDADVQRDGNEEWLRAFDAMLSRALPLREEGGHHSVRTPSP